jgi:hypothetical protein
LKSFYTSFLLRIKWDKDRKIVGGEIQQAQGTQQDEPAKGFFRGLDIERIAHFIEDHLEVPGVDGKPKGGSDEGQTVRNGDSSSERE